MAHTNVLANAGLWILIVGFIMFVAGIIWADIEARKTTPAKGWTTVGIYILLVGGLIVAIAGFCTFIYLYGYSK